MCIRDRGLAASWLGRFVLAGLSQFVAGSAAIRVLNDLRVKVFAHIQALSVSYFDQTRAGASFPAPTATSTAWNRC